MPNGRNAGRLFADCTGEHGYGESHSMPSSMRPGDIETCLHCKRTFRLRDDLTLKELQDTAGIWLDCQGADDPLEEYGRRLAIMAREKEARDARFYTERVERMRLAREKERTANDR